MRNQHDHHASTRARSARDHGASRNDERERKCHDGRERECHDEHEERGGECTSAVVANASDVFSVFELNEA